MIAKLTEYLVKELNAYFSLLSATSGDRVVAANLFDQQTGSVNSEAIDKLILSVVNIEEDNTYHSLERYQKTDDGQHQMVRPEVRLNIYILFIANYTDYQESLKAVSHLIAFFQHRPAFDIAAIATNNNKKGRISLMTFPMSFEQQNHVWGMIGGKYLPSVMYKASILTIQDEQVEAIAAPVETIIVNEAE